MQTNYYQQCPICNSSFLNKKYQINNYLIDQCANCNVVFVKNILTEDILSKYYQDSSDENVYIEDNRKCLDFYYRRLKGKIDKFRPIPGKILDIGCSEGQFLDIMDGWEKFGCEISENQGKKAKNKYGTNIFIGDFYNYPEQKNRFDIITLQDVLDHFIDPVKALKKCDKMLKPGGNIFIKVHNISCLYAKLARESFYAIIPPYHLFYFNKNSLNFLLSSMGYNVKDYSFIPHLLKIQTIFYRLSKQDYDSLYYKFYNILKDSYIGNITIRKNLHDIITVTAEKPVLHE
jgi:SAM-dependent methyltransferase